MSYIHRHRAYNFHAYDPSKYISTPSPSSSQPHPRAVIPLTQPQTDNINANPNLSNNYIHIPSEPQMLILLILVLIVLTSWIVYGMYYSVRFCVGRGVIRCLDGQGKREVGMGGNCEKVDEGGHNGEGDRLAVRYSVSSGTVMGLRGGGLDDGRGGLDDGRGGFVWRRKSAV